MIRRAIFGAGVTTAAGQLLRRLTRDRPLGSGPRWERSNYRGHTVSLSGGAATALGAIIVAAAAPAPVRVGALLTTTVSAGIGLADDFDSDPTSAKGLKGHLAALSRGEMTTGAMKLVGISGTALASAALMGAGRNRTRIGAGVDALTSGALIAGTANLINLFDLRPGRALKVTALMVAGLALDPSYPYRRDLVPAILGVALGAAPGDLREETMLGDVGANSLGGLVGVALANHPRPWVRAGALGAVTGLILASEKVSFSKVIDRTAIFAQVDSWGRVPW